ncbi:MAG TPA: hypothetical protein VGA17_13195 [Nitrospiraceae bacterium]
MRDDVRATVTVCGERKGRLNVVGGKVGKVVQHLGNGHATTEIIKKSATVMRVPRMQGLPLRMRGSMVMRSR